MPDRLTESPMPASVCPNCGAYHLYPRCVCGYVDPAYAAAADAIEEMLGDDDDDPESTPLEDSPGE